MQRTTFYLQLCIITLIVFLLLNVLYHYQGNAVSYQNLNHILVGLFVLFSIIIFEMAQRASQRSDKSAFVRLSMIASFAKLLLVLVLILAFRKIYPTLPRSGFIIPFLAVYLPFTIFESYFMAKIAKS
ncbi:MAG: hypothetical protein KA974_02890 [Saprospiraceae bacterium]|nr:hypothetical protein [Saprospiraceae bacterium]MBP7679404.1 hypothetical protein [Saprospiraceae bacterium]